MVSLVTCYSLSNKYKIQMEKWKQKSTKTTINKSKSSGGEEKAEEPKRESTREEREKIN